LTCRRNHLAFRFSLEVDAGRLRRYCSTARSPGGNYTHLARTTLSLHGTQARKGKEY
jgi:hypothetical protein